MELKHYICVIGKKTRSLLIVPYGIETGSKVDCLQYVVSFNRTLWN